MMTICCDRKSWLDDNTRRLRRTRHLQRMGKDRRQLRDAAKLHPDGKIN